MASNPSAWPSLRMGNASMPAPSTRSSAACRIRSRLRGRRGSVVVAIDKAYGVRITYAISLRCTKERSMAMMQAVVHHRYGRPDVLKLEEVQTPEPPDDGVLVRV